MARSIILNLIGNNRTGGAFRQAREDADHTARSLDDLGKSSDRASGRFSLLSKDADTLGGKLRAAGQKASPLVAGLLAVAPAAGAAGAAVVGAAGAMAAAFASAGAAGGAFFLAVKPQLEGIGQAVKASEKGVAEYRAELAKLPPASRETATALVALKKEYKSWSNALAGDTMPVFTKGINIARGLLPQLTPLVKTGAAALGGFMDQLGKDTKSSGFSKFLARLNATAKKTFPPLLKSVRNVAIGLGGIVDAFLPHAGAMANGIEGVTAGFAKWGKALKDSEGFKGFIAYIRANLPQLQQTFGNLVQIVVNLATAFAPMTGISLMLVKNFSAMLAALPPPVVTALATAFVAASMAAKVWVPIQTALNVVLSANPIGIVVLAIAGLVAGLVLAYKKSETFRGIVNGVWSGVKGVVGKAWTETIKPALQGLGSLFKKAYEIWQDKWPAMQQLLSDVSAFFTDTLFGAIDKVTGAFGKLSGAAEGATGKISGVGQGFQSTEDDGNKFLGWSNFFGAALGAALLGPFGSTVGYVTTTFWPEMKSGFQAGFETLTTNAETFAVWLTGKLSSGFGSVATNARSIFVDWLPGAVGRGLGLAAESVTSGLARVGKAFFGGLPPLRLSWSSLWTWVKAFGGRLLDQAAAAVRNSMNAIKNAFSAGVDGIRAAWGRLPGGVKIAVNWVIDRAYNRGLRSMWNTVMDWLHLPGGLHLGKIPALERGGTLANPARARPMVTNGPMAIVGEGRPQWPEYVIPTDPRFRGRAQALWASAGGDLQMLAKGGVLGGAFGQLLGGVKKLAGKVTGLGKTALAMLENPKRYWDSLAAKMMPRPGEISGQGKLGAGLSAIPGKLLAQSWTAAQQILATFKKAYGGDGAGVVKAAASMIGMGDDRGENNNWLTRAWNMPGAPWCAMFVSEAIKKAGALRKYPGAPSAAVASFVGAMRHVGRTEGRPGDLGAYRGTGHINVIAKSLGGGLYETIGGNEGPRVKRSVRGGQSAILRPLARGGIMDQRRKDLRAYRERNLDPGDRRSPLLRYMRHAVYDRGGLLQPGYTLAYNGTGRPEPVVSLARGGTVRAARSTATTTSLAARRKAGTSLVKGLTGATITDVSKLTSWFNKLDAAIKKAFAGRTEKKLLTWSNAIEKAMGAAAKQASAISAKISEAKEYAATVTSSARDFAKLSGLTNKGSAGNIASGLGDRAAALTTFAGQITQLSKRGLATDLIRQIVDMGPAEGSQLAGTVLAGTAAQIKQMNAAQAKINKAAGVLGTTAADVLYDAGKGAGKGFLTGLQAQKTALDKEMSRLGTVLAGQVKVAFGLAKNKSYKSIKVKAVKYDSGGMLQPGFTLAYNATGRPETVRTHRQEAALAAAAAGAPLVGELHLHGVEGYRVPQDVMRGLRQYEKARRLDRRG